MISSLNRAVVSARKFSRVGSSLWLEVLWGLKYSQCILFTRRGVGEPKLGPARGDRSTEGHSEKSGPRTGRTGKTG